MSDLDLKALRELAEKATPGPWNLLPGARSNLVHIETDVDCPAGAGLPICSIPKTRIADAEYIHATQPPVALALLDRIEEQAREIERLRTTSNNCVGILMLVQLALRSRDIQGALAHVNAALAPSTEPPHD